MRLLCLSTVLLFLIACTSVLESARNSVAARASGEEVELRALQKYPGGIVCGEYQKIDPWAGGGKFKKFIYWDDVADLRPSEDDLQVFCTADPSASLYDKFGIRLSADSADRHAKIREDYGKISAALEQFYTHNMSYPRTRDGLVVLVGRPGGNINPGPLPSGGYLKELPTDPWARPYLYTGPGLAGVKLESKLQTLGADGLPGGRDENADIGNWQMRYIDYMEKL